jgi:hypothetical protein
MPEAVILACALLTRVSFYAYGRLRNPPEGPQRVEHGPSLIAAPGQKRRVKVEGPANLQQSVDRLMGSYVRKGFRYVALRRFVFTISCDQIAAIKTTKETL